MADEPIGSTAVAEPPVVVDVGTPQVEGVAGEQVEGAATAPEPLDADYVSRAKAFSLNEDDLRSTSRDVVERMMANADRMTINAARAEYQQPPAPIVRRENGQFAPAPAPAAPVPGDFAYEPWKPEFTQDDEVAEPITKNMTGLEKHLAAQIDRLHQFYGSKLQEHDQFRTDQIVQRNNAAMDRFIESSGPDWKEVFGTGPTSEMNPQSQEFLNRVEAWTAANAMTQKYGNKMTVQAALPRARNAMFMEKAFAIERAKANGKRTQLEAGASDRARTPGGVPVPMTIKDKARLMREAAMSA
jgi:hypothetical protein